MSESIIKLDLAGDYFSLSIPKGGVILSVGVQHTVPRMWVRITLGQPNVERKFKIVSTGCCEESLGAYIGTWQEGVFVRHLFEIV